MLEISNRWLHGIGVAGCLFFAPFWLSAQVTVNWAGGGDGVSWQDPANWDNNQVPRTTNDVVINVPLSTVIVSRSNVTVRSVQCTGGILITNSDFAVTAGASIVNGLLAISLHQTLTVQSSNTTFTANGAASIPGAHLTATGGGLLELTTYGRHVDASVQYANRTWTATGAGSILRFSGLTNLTGATAGGLLIRSFSGGRIEFPALTTTSPAYFQAYTDGVGSTVDFPVLTVSPRGGSDFEARNGGTVSMPMITQWSDGNITIRRTNSFIPTAQLTIFSNSTLSADGFTPDLTNLVDAPISSFYADAGAVVSLPNVQWFTNAIPQYQNRVFQANGAGSVINLNAMTNLGSPASGGGLYLRAYNGGQVLVESLAQLNPAYFNIYADGVNSLISLPNVTNSPGRGSDFEARNGGTLALPLVTRMLDCSLVIRKTNSVLPTAQLTLLSNVTVTVDACAPNFSNVSDIPVSSFYTEAGGVISLPNVTWYTNAIPQYQNRVFQANGAGSVVNLNVITNFGSAASGGGLYLRSYNGGKVLVENLQQLNPAYYNIYADGANSLVSLPLVANSPGRGSDIEARTGGTVAIPLITEIHDGALTIRNTNSVLPTAQLTVLSNASITVDACAPDLSNVTDVPLCSFYVAGGGNLTLPNVRWYTNAIPQYQSREFRASGAGSILNLNAITNLGSSASLGVLYIRAYTGGQVLLNGLTMLNPAPYNIYAEGAGAQVSLANVLNSPGDGTALEARSGGALLFPNLIYATNLSLVIRGTSSSFALQQVTSLANSSLTVDAVDLVLSNVTDISLANLYVENGGRLRLPSTTSYPPGIPAFQSREFRATGAGSILDLSSVTDLSGSLSGYSSLYLRAYSGGKVILTNVVTVPVSVFTVYAEGNNSVVDLSQLTTSPRKGSSFEARTGGRVQIPLITLAEDIQMIIRNTGVMTTTQMVSLSNSTVTVEAATPDFFAVTNCNLANLYVSAGGKLSLPGVTSHVGPMQAFNGRTWQASDANSSLELTNLLFTFHGTPGYATLNVRTMAGGNVRLDQFGRIDQSVVTFYSERANSRIIAPALTNWSGFSEVEANLGGFIQLTTNTPLVASNVHVTLHTDSTISVGELQLYAGSELKGSGALAANVINGAQVRPGTSPGSMTVNNYTQLTNGTLFIEFAGTAPGTGFDVLNVSGAAALDGTLSVSRLNNFQPPLNQTYRIVSAGSRTGEFGGYTGLDAGGNAEFQPSFDATGALLTTVFATGPIATNAVPSGPIIGSLAYMDVIFNEPVAGSSLGTNDGILTGPSGGIPLANVYLISSRTVRFTFAPQTTPGTYTLIAGPNISDIVGNAMNQDGDATNGEATQDRFTNSVTISIADLAVTNVIAPVAALPGESFPVVWTVLNTGLQPAAGGRSDAIWLSTDLGVGNDTLVGLLASAQSLPAGGSITLTQSVTVPRLGPAGNLRVLVQADYYQALAESGEGNNYTFATNDLAVPYMSFLELTTNVVSETNAFLKAQISRNGELANPLTVSLSSSNPGEIQAPATVVIPAGQNSALFDLTPVADGVADGAQSVLITATAASFVSASNTLTVLDANTPSLALRISQSIIGEGAFISASVARPVASTQALVVNVVSASPGQLSAPATVTIPADQTNAAFNITAVEDTYVEATRSYTISASAQNYFSATGSVSIVDNDIPALEFALSANSVSEAAGAVAIMATLSRSFIAPAPVIVNLSSSHPQRLVVPASVTIPAGQSSTTFALSAVDNALLDGPQLVTIAALPTETLTGQPLPPGISTNVLVTDDDGPAFSLRLNRSLVAEGLNPAATVTITRNTPATNDLLVDLTSSDTTEAKIAAHTTIPTGQASVTVNIESLNDGQTDGNQSVTITASSPGFSSGSATLVVSDVNLPDLVITSLTVPTNALTDTYASVSYRESNLGLNTATGSWVQAVYLSRDPYPGDDDLLGIYAFSGAVPPGLFFERTVSVRIPSASGDYWIVVVSDPTNAIPESLENNNTAVSAIPIHVNSAYTATVQTATETALAGTPIVFTGSAQRAESGPAAYSLVNIHLKVRGTKRVIAALTDVNGNFSATFTPLPGEAGAYTVGAAHPGESDAPIQDSFSLLGGKFDPTSLNLKIAGLGSSTGNVAVVNLSETPLSNLSATVLGAPPELNVTVTLSGSVNGSSSVLMPYTITSIADSNYTAIFLIRVTSTEGVSLDLPVTVAVEALRPRLESVPGTLVAGMLRGAQTVYNFTLRNSGGAATGPINLLLPPAPFLSLASPAVLPSLEPGQSNAVTLLLTPASDLPLTDYNGSLVAQGTGFSLSIPFSFRALSDGRGSLLVTAVDEYTYYAEGAPRVAGAALTLKDSLSHLAITNGVTATNGTALFENLAEGYYDLEATADNHTTARQTLFLASGRTNESTVFLSREAVKLIWTVTPTEIEDRTRITLETVFETFVPIPVITVEPNLIDLALCTNEVTQIDLKITNHGLIAADNFRLNFTDSPNWHFEPLLTDLGVLPARSSLTIPLLIRKVPGLRGAGAGNCPSANAAWTLICGFSVNGYSTPIALENAGGGCGGIITSCCGGGGGGGIGATYSPVFVGASPIPCNPCGILILGTLYLCALDIASPPWVDCPRGAYDCYNSPTTNVLGTAYTCGRAALSCTEMGLAAAGVTAPAAGALEALNTGLDLIDCANNLYHACDGISTASLTASTGPTKPPVRQFVGDSIVSNQVERLRALMAPTFYIFGDEKWFRSRPATTTVTWMAKFYEFSEESSDGSGRLTPAEQAVLMALPLPATLTTNDAQIFMDRWNRTLDYNQAGIRDLADVPTGGNTNFIARDILGALVSNSVLAAEANQAEGHTNLLSGLQKALSDVKAYYENTAVAVPGLVGGAKARQAAGGGICARVRLQLNQEAVIARDAFEASLEIVNGLNEPLSNVRVDLDIKNERGESVNPIFGINPPTLNGIAAVDGTGSVAAGTTATAKWRLLPSREAAGSAPILYRVGGSISYYQGDLRVVVPLSPVPITVMPIPNLLVDYFWQRDVLSDDPFTDEVEPTIPFSLGVLVRNTGQGEARNLRITSSQPKIIENTKGLLIDFSIIATEVGGRNLVPSLTADFGTIPPQGVGVARWLMTSTLQGQFIEYNAKFEHLDSLGDPRFSLIEQVNIHELIHVVRAGGTFEDGLPDFLANDFSDFDALPDTLYFSGGSNAPVNVVQTAVTNVPVSATNLTIQLNAPMSNGWFYLRVPDPSAGKYRLSRIVRSDSTVISLDTNAWVSDRTFIGNGQRPVKENILHLLDYDSTGQYTLTYATLPTPDTNAPSSQVAALPADSHLQIPLQWSGADGTNGSGVGAYDIYVAVNSGPFTLWLSNSTRTGSIFLGTNGNTYAFYSVATDRAGNREPAPATADAQTLVSLVNTPPQLTAAPAQTINEGDLLVITNTATDADIPANRLTFSLGAGTPPGVTINPNIGLVTWYTGEGTGPSTNLITIIAADDGQPPLSATGFVTVVVNEVNRAPSIAPIGTNRIAEGVLFTLPMAATDPDLPASTLTWSIPTNSPAGAAINPQTGVFTWTPTPLQGPSTNNIQFIVTDNGTPPLSATQTVIIIVRDTQGDFVLAAGTAAAQPGETNSLPLHLLAGVEIVNLQFDLTTDHRRLTNFTLLNPSPEIASATVLPVSDDLVSVSIVAQSGVALNAGSRLASFSFQVLPDAQSGFVPIKPLALSGTHSSGAALTNGLGHNGRVVVVGNEPLVEMLRGTPPTLLLWAKPGLGYQVEADAELRNGWSPWNRITMTNLYQNFDVTNPPPRQFFRAYREGN